MNMILCSAFLVWAVVLFIFALLAMKEAVVCWCNHRPSSFLAAGFGALFLSAAAMFGYASLRLGDLI